MVLPLSSASVPPANTRLAPAEQTLTAQPLEQSAKQALASAGPAAVYHPSEAAQAQPSGPAPKYIETWVGRSQSPEFPKLAELATTAQRSLKASFQAFQSRLELTHPDLATKKYGFTVQADGALKVLDTSGKLSSTDTQRLTDLLNSSMGLKESAAKYRDASIDMVDADSPWSGSYLGRYNLTKENFADAIDLKPLLTDRSAMSIQEFSDGLFFNQLAYKGELATRETEAAMLERRAEQRLSLYA